MGHNLDITAGQAGFVSARTDAWHHLGTTLPETFTAEQAMEHGLLGGWDVRKTPLTTAVGDRTLEIPGRYATVRNNPVTPGQVDVLGVVGETYKVIQNEAHAAFLNALVDESGAHFETAGSLAGGRQVFITMKMPGHMKIGGQDQVDTYLAAINSHDGSSAFTLLATPVRIVCQNTLNVAYGAATNAFRVRHSIGAEDIMIGAARQALDLTFDYLDAFQADAQRLIETTMTQSTFEQMIAAEYGVPDDAPKTTIGRTEKKLDRMAELFADAQTQEGIRGTAWAGFNALTEYADHFAPTRGQDRDTARYINAALYPDFKTRALAVVKKAVSLV